MIVQCKWSFIKLYWEFWHMHCIFYNVPCYNCYVCFVGSYIVIQNFSLSTFHVSTQVMILSIVKHKNYNSHKTGGQFVYVIIKLCILATLVVKYNLINVKPCSYKPENTFLSSFTILYCDAYIGLVRKIPSISWAKMIPNNT